MVRRRRAARRRRGGGRRPPRVRGRRGARVDDGRRDRVARRSAGRDALRRQRARVPLRPEMLQHGRQAVGVPAPVRARPRALPLLRPRHPVLRGS